MPIHVLAFDAYRTLLDPGDDSVAATAEILRKNHSSLDARDVYRRWKQVHLNLIRDLQCFEVESAIFAKGLDQVYREFGIAGRAQEDVGIMLRSVNRGRPAYADALVAVRALQNHVRVVVASNSDAVPLANDVKQSGLGITECYSSEDLRAYKPSPVFYQRLLDRLQCDAANVVFVGDSWQADVIGPKAAGMRAIWANRNGAARGQDAAPDAEVRDLSTLESVIQRMA
jgi:2-haloalkanoic acid dehalogenase type II